MTYTPPVLPDVSGGTFAVPAGAPGPHSKLHSDERDAIVAAGTELAAHETDAAHLHIDVNEPPPHCFVDPVRGVDAASNDGRFDRPKQTVRTGMLTARGGMVYLAPGIFTELLHLTSADGDFAGTQVIGAGWGATIWKPGVAAPAIWLEGSNTITHKDMLWKGFVIDGRDGSGNKILTYGFRLRAAQSARFEHVKATLCNGPGWFTDVAASPANATGIHYVQCEASFNAGSGLKHTGGVSGGNTYVDGGYFGNNDPYGMEFDNTSNVIKRAWMANNWMFAARVSNVANVFDRCLIEANWRIYSDSASPVLSALRVWGKDVSGASGFTAYLRGNRVMPSDTTLNYAFQALNDGTAGGAEPAWSTAPNPADTIVDGGVTWMNVGPMRIYGGAGIDDTGANRLSLLNPDYVYQRFLGGGNSAEMHTESTVGGAWAFRFGHGTPGPGLMSGARIYGQAGTFILEGQDDLRADAHVKLLPQGAGHVIAAALLDSSAGGIETKLISGAGRTTVQDSDFASAPPNGTVAIVRNTTDSKARLGIRVNGVWLHTEVS